MSYYFNKTLNLSFDKAIVRVTEELKKEGFGILTDIDVKARLRRNSMSNSENTGFSAPATHLLHTRHCRQRIR